MRSEMASYLAKTLAMRLDGGICLWGKRGGDCLLCVIAEKCGAICGIPALSSSSSRRRSDFVRRGAHGKRLGDLWCEGGGALLPPTPYLSTMYIGIATNVLLRLRYSYTIYPGIGIGIEMNTSCEDPRAAVILLLRERAKGERPVFGE